MPAPVRILLLALTLIQTSTPPLAFDTVSIRPDASGKPFGTLAQPPDSDRFTATNATLERIVAFAFNFRQLNLITGTPAWAQTQRFDMLARIADADLPAYHRLTLDQQRMLLQQALAARTNLHAHLEQRTIPVYALVAAHPSPGLRATPPNSDPVLDSNGKATVEDHLLTRRGDLEAQSIPLASLALALSIQADRPVVDRTNLPGLYTFHLQWDPDPDAPDSNHPTLFTALPDQLGLRLQPTRASMQVLVLDSLDHPTAN